MRLISSVLLVFVLSLSLYAKDEKININFKDLKIMDLVKITSKIIDKNILVTDQIAGNVDFISNKPLDKDELIKILTYVLEDKGYTLVQSNEILRIVKLNDSAKSNVPVLTPGSSEEDYTSMVTSIFPVHNADADYIASKIRHLISKNGKLVTNKDSNTLVITDFAENISTVKEVVSIMTYGGKKDSLIVNLKNVVASDAKKNLDAIAKSKFNEKIETEKVAIVDNKDNNSLVLIGKKQNIDYLANYIKKIDNDGSLTKREVEVIPLKNVEAVNVIKIIDAIIGKKTYVDPNDKPLASIDEESNALVIMGPSDELDYVKDLINELDKDKPQVYVLAKIIEVSETKTKNVGLKYGLEGGVSGSSGLFSFASNLGGSSVVLGSTVSSVIEMPDSLKKGLALGATINLLKQNQAIDVVSEPSILCINNKESSIYVGETRSFETGSTTNESGTTSSYKREDIGLTLKVKPRISNKDKVTLEINTILEDAKEITSESQTNPDTTKKEVKTSAIVSSGEAVIIGGLIKNKSDITKDDVPFFSEIPILGNLFKNNKRVNDKINLVIVVTPYIIPTAKDLTYIRNQLARLNSLENKYVKELEIRLEERKIANEKEELERLKRKEELAQELKKVQKEKNELLNIKDEASTQSDETTHEQRVKEILGY